MIAQTTLASMRTKVMTVPDALKGGPHPDIVVQGQFFHPTPKRQTTIQLTVNSASGGQEDERTGTGQPVSDSGDGAAEFAGAAGETTPVGPAAGGAEGTYSESGGGERCGRVLLAGGVDERGELVTRLEVWDPVSRTMETLAETLREGKRGHTARLLANGNVLVGGEEVGYSRTPMETEDPRVAASLPVDGAKDVPLEQWIAVRFTRAARVDSITKAAVVLRKEADGEARVKVVGAEAGMRAFVTPEVPLEAGAAYELTLVGVTDAVSPSALWRSPTQGTVMAAGLLQLRPARKFPRTLATDSLGGLCPARFDRWRCCLQLV